MDSTYCVKPTRCCEGEEQCCCLHYRCAFPCTKDVPCMFTLLPFCVCYPKVKCCASMAAIFPPKEDAKDVEKKEGTA